jgi:polyisoprenoid-binding protein YceI
MLWEIDNAHSMVEFAVKHMMITTVKGRFIKFSGTVELDEANPSAAEISGSIDVASIDTGQEPRDAHLRSPDFFDAARYPTITFSGKRVESLGGDRYRLIGDLTIHGVTREVPLEVTVEGQIKDMQGRRRASYALQTTISRKEFGLNWNVALESGGWLVSDAVKIAIEAQLIAAVPAGAQQAQHTQTTQAQ